MTPGGCSLVFVHIWSLQWLQEVLLFLLVGEVLHVSGDVCDSDVTGSDTVALLAAPAAERGSKGERRRRGGGDIAE